MQQERVNNTPAQASIVIVGAGPTGMAMGNLLGMAGIDTLILERNATVDNGPRAITFDDEGLRICQAMGLGNALMHHVLQGLSAHYLSRGRQFGSAFPSNRVNGYPIISTFHQPDFEDALLKGLKRFPCVRLCFQHTVEECEQSDSCVRVRVRTPEDSLAEIECAYLLACNGGKQALRQKLGIPMRGITYPQQWMVLDCIDDEETQEIRGVPARSATFFCDPERPVVTVMLPHRRRRWEFMLFPGETEEQVLSDEHVRSLLQQVYGPRQPQVVRCATYTFHATLAERFSNGRVFLLGDAAHMMPPFGGQGMNSCLRDAHNLAWKLALVLQELASPSILDSYHQERHAPVASMIRFSSFLGQLVMPRSRPLALLRDQSFHLMNAIPYTRTVLSEVRFKPQSRLKTGMLLSRFNWASRRYAGRMLPQPVVQDERGERKLLDELLGSGFALLRLHSQPAQAFAGLSTEPWQKLRVRFVCVQPIGQLSTPTSAAAVEGSYEVAQDSEGHISDFLCRDQRLYLLVRPDRYILGAFTEEEAGRFIDALQRLLQGTGKNKYT